MQKLETALAQEGLLTEIRQKVVAAEDHKAILSALKNVKKGNLYAAAIKFGDKNKKEK